MPLDIGLCHVSPTLFMCNCVWWSTWSRMKGRADPARHLDLPNIPVPLFPIPFPASHFFFPLPLSVHSPIYLSPPLRRTNSLFIIH